MVRVHSLSSPYSTVPAASKISCIPDLQGKAEIISQPFPQILLRRFYHQRGIPTRTSFTSKKQATECIFGSPPAVRHVILLVALAWRGRGIFWRHVNTSRGRIEVHSMIPFPSCLPCICLVYIWALLHLGSDPHLCPTANSISLLASSQTQCTRYQMPRRQHMR